uniref:Putative uncharacterized protein YGL052W n=1 Tax=Saccharomyces cerevisiae (strain ATCC 204508 / S288c) TaxID=559292 RepID=YGF2_YEAST|nr:RecName: Full=Putative uncharacterized protein YGL052W [Saccharomyces cerevisiae S288C]CAA96753.1 unnamed protein product [Saccharomyces cerevisiae]
MQLPQKHHGTSSVLVLCCDKVAHCLITTFSLYITSQNAILKMPLEMKNNREKGPALLKHLISMQWHRDNQEYYSHRRYKVYIGHADPSRKYRRQVRYTQRT